MIGDYERVGVVARGAHSTIWKGFDPGLKREVALKQLSGSGAGEAARREAAALAGLRHPNILSVYDVLEDAEGVWLIEQWITGAPLSAVLARDRETAGDRRFGLDPRCAARSVLCPRARCGPW